MTTIKVRPTSDGARAVLRHPTGRGFDSADGTGTWPADQFTFRRLDEGAIARADAPAAVVLKAPALGKSSVVSAGVVPDSAYLRTAEPRAKQLAVEIPPDWRARYANDWTGLRSLAASVSDHPVRSRADAEKAIDAELARRAKGE